MRYVVAGDEEVVGAVLCEECRGVAGRLVWALVGLWALGYGRWPESVSHYCPLALSTFCPPSSGLLVCCQWLARPQAASAPRAFAFRPPKASPDAPGLLCGGGL